MTTKHKLLVCTGLVAGLHGLLATGCASGPAPYNPLNTGRVSSARKFSADGRGESRNGLPTGTLAAEAMILSLSETEVCFDLTLRTTGAREDLTNPQGWRIKLAGENPDFETEDFSVRALRAVEAQRYAAQGNKLLTLAAQACQLAGKCSQEAVDRATWSGDRTVLLSGGGMVCFENQGRIRPSTDIVKLYLDDQRAEWQQRTRHSFRWEFRP